MKKLFYFFLPLLAFVACEDNGIDGLKDKSPLSTLTSVSNFNPNGEAAIVETSLDGASVTLKYEVIPASCATVLSEQWENYVTLQALYSNSEEIDFVEMPIREVVADEDNGIITVTASGENLSTGFYSGLVEASCRLVISDSKNELRSEYRKLTCSRWLVETLPSPQSNEIYYTASNVVSSNMNDVVSNVYDYTKGCYIMTFKNPITEIGESAFYSCTNLTSITIPDSVTRIGYAAFNGCSGLASITIPDSVTEIGGQAFVGCSSLTSVYINDIAAWCGILLSDGFSNPLEYAHNLYLNGELVTDLVIPDSVTKIGNHAFSGCSSLTSVTIGDSVTEIGWSAFRECLRLTSITIPDSVTTIGHGAFSDCFRLTSITIPDSVTTIGDSAFASCSLTSITIPDSVTKIGNHAFSNCRSLKEFKGKFAADGGRCLIKDNTIIAYANASGTTYTIPDSVTTIGEGAFDGCISLKSITIPDSVTEIGDLVFRNCSSLTSVTIPDIVTEIGACAFSGCSSLTSVTIPDNATTIAYSAFSGCSSLTSVTIPDSVTYIGWVAFEDCSNLTSVYCKPTTPPTGSLAMFKAIGTSAKIYVPVGSGKAYKTAQYWSDYASIIEEKAM